MALPIGPCLVTRPTERPGMMRRVTQDELRVRFRGAIIPWRGPSPYHFVPVPADACADLRAIAPLVSYGWGVIPVTGRVGRTEFTTSLFPKAGGYLVPIKDLVRKRESLAAGDVVDIELIVGR